VFSPDFFLLGSGMTAKGSSKPRKIVGEAYLNQITILRSLLAESGPSRQYQINEIAERSGLRDEKEIQRYLYILEGQKLVSPFPEGDFTSKTWFITKDGMRALKTIEQAQAA
jgi:hypothetical protein